MTTMNRRGRSGWTCGLFGLACLLLLAGCSSGSPRSSMAPMTDAGPRAVDAPRVQPAAAVPASGAVPGAMMVQAVNGPPPNAPSRPATYLLGPGDVIEVSVFKVDELATTARVDEAGGIMLPLIGQILVGGLTPEQAGRKIADAYAQDHLQDPQVSLLVTEYANMSVTVGGAVNKPGVFPMTGRMTLLQAISMAEGVTELAEQEEVVIFRNMPAQPTSAYVVDLKKVQRGDLADPLLAVNDRVIVPESGTAVLIKNVTGSIRGIFNLNPFYL